MSSLRNPSPYENAMHGDKNAYYIFYSLPCMKYSNVRNIFTSLTYCTFACVQWKIAEHARHHKQDEIILNCSLEDKNLCRFMFLQPHWPIKPWWDARLWLWGVINKWFTKLKLCLWYLDKFLYFKIQFWLQKSYFNETNEKKDSDAIWKCNNVRVRS